MHALVKSALGTSLGFARGISTTPAAASLAAVEKLVREMKGKRTMPWETSLSEADAAAALSAFWGGAPVAPGDVLDLGVDQMEALLAATSTGAGNKALDDALFAHAESVTRRFFANEVYFRGIVEFSNVCEYDCYYCGVRKHQPRTWRYTMPVEEVVGVAEWAFRHKMGTLMLQSGQLTTPQRNEYILDMVRRVRAATVALDLEQHAAAAAAEGGPASAAPPPSPDADDLGLCVALSVGELPPEQYAAFREAGAARYLLRIETSNPDLYATLHPPHQPWDARVAALRDAKAAGFMIGTGVMVGLPGQTLRDLAGDLAFFRDLGADMIGMGPYITEPGTPAAEMWDAQFGGVDKTAHMKGQVALTTRMNALARVTLGNVNIAATTALQAIDPVGREIALRRGANVLMPILTPTKYREHYTLYEGKPCINDTAEECQKCLNARLSMVGKKLKPGVWGDPPSFRERLRPVSMATPKRSFSSASMRGARGLHTGAYAGGQAPGAPECGACGAPAAAAAPACPVPTGPAFTAAARANGPAAFASGSASKGSDTPRTNIGIFGRMNAGKSSLMNRLTRSEVSIVDSTPGTTADTKVALMELHAAGPVKLFDTAGVDEEGGLGDKKRRKVLATLKECDVVVVVVSLNALQAGLGGSSDDDALREALRWEGLLVERAAAAEADAVLVFNRPGGAAGDPALDALQDRARGVLDPERRLPAHAAPLAEPAAALPLSSFVEEAAVAANAAHAVPCLPEEYLNGDAMVFLNIPMDAETPSMRLLRPQALVQEEAIRRFATTVAYRMNLDAARSGDPAAVEAERARFLRALRPALDHPGPAIIVTDSQAVDILHPWTLDASGQPLIPFTTFSIAMVHRQSRGALPVFAAGIDAFRALRPGDRVLVAEACNHNRITELCNDIGMVQIPNKLQAQAAATAGGASAPGAGAEAPQGGVIVEHAFGREFPELDDPESGGLARFQLAVHCGGCMVDPQKIRARVSDLQEAGVPVTNYGLLLAYAHSPDAMRRALEPWGVAHPH